MAESPAALTDPEERGQLRRQQILDAAACFVREGFHGASIARIAKAAGMSPGNLYHFFPGKEAMIAALVQQRLDQSLALFAEIEAAVDPLQAMLDRVAVTLEQQTDPEQAALSLEILAEAGRNPAVASIVRAADDAIREHLVRLHHDARKARGLPGQDAGGEAVGEPVVAREAETLRAQVAVGNAEALVEAGAVGEPVAAGEPEAVTELLVAIFQGLPARAISHPELDKARLLPVLRRALASLF